MRYAGAPRFREADTVAAGVTGRLEGIFNSMAAIERYIGDLAAVAARA
jgi:hypothetical protein